MAQEVAEKEKKKDVVPVHKGEVQRRRDVDHMMDQVDQMMADLWKRPFSGLFPSFPSLLRPSRTLLGESLQLRMPTVDLYEEQEEVILKAEVPGLSKEDLKIDLADNMITLSGEKKKEEDVKEEDVKEEDVKEEDYTYSERSYGAFSRSLPLPCAVKAEQAKATFKNGVLEVKLPKTEEAKKRKISVQIQ